jgi:hypothetical protein
MPASATASSASSHPRSIRCRRSSLGARLRRSLLAAWFASGAGAIPSAPADRTPASKHPRAQHIVPSRSAYRSVGRSHRTPSSCRRPRVRSVRGSPCALLHSAPGHWFTRLHGVATPRRQPAIHVTCPVCHWTEAVLAYETRLARCCLCPHCQHVWDAPKIPRKPRSPLPLT